MTPETSDGETEGESKAGHETQKEDDVKLPLNSSQAMELQEFTSKETVAVTTNTSKRALVVMLIIINFIISICTSVMAPFFPKKAEEKGASPTEYGLVLGVAPLVTLIVSSLAGKFSDLVQPPQFIRYGLFLYGACIVGFGVLEHVPAGMAFIVLAFILRIIGWVGYATITFASFTICYTLFPKRTGTAYAAVDSSMMVGEIVGPVIGGALYELGGYQTPFYTLGGLQVVICGLAFIFVPDKIGKESLKRGNYKKFLKSGVLICDVSIIIGCSVVYGFTMATLEPHLRQFTLQPIMLSLIFIINAIVDASLGPFVGMILDRSTDPQIYSLLACLCCAIAMIIIGPAPVLPMDTKLWSVCVALGVMGLAGSAMGISSFCNLLLSAKKRGFPDDRSTYAMANAVLLCSDSIAAFIGPSLGGFLLEHLGYKNASMVEFGIIVTVGVSVVAFKCIQRMREKKHQEINQDQESHLQHLASTEVGDE